MYIMEWSGVTTTFLERHLVPSKEGVNRFVDERHPLDWVQLTCNERLFRVH
jgi:hypothetical protein